MLNLWDKAVQTKFIIARNIRARRKVLGYSQRELASQIYLTRSAMSRTEQGTRSVCAEELPQLAAALQLRISDLFLP